MSEFALRDQYAGMIMQGFVASEQVVLHSDQADLDAVFRSFRIAELMVAEANRRENEANGDFQERLNLNGVRTPWEGPDAE